MAEATLGPRTFTLPASRVEAREWAVAHWDILALGAIMVVAALLRFWGLGDRALHHDESLHAHFSWLFYDGRQYRHDPLMHGPFLFHISAAVYFLFGASDFTARIPAALFGTALVGMPCLLKKQIGIKAVLIAAVFLAFSPTILYFSRFDRNEAWVAAFTLGIVICIWRYLDEQKPGWLYGLAALMALSFASKEVTFIFVAIALVYVDLMLAVELGKRREGEQVDSFSVFARTAILVPVAWLMAALWPLIGERPFGRERLPPIGDVMVVLGTLALPQFAAGIQVLPFVGNDGYNVESEDQLRITTVSVLIVLSAYVGLLWKAKVWLACAAFFYVPFVLLYTTFFSNQPAPWTAEFWNGRGGFFSGIWGSLDYWLDQHHVKRGNQPSYYYALLTPLYEFLPLLLALGGAAWMTVKGDSFKRWLLFWFAAYFIGLSLAGEKMPWLEVHIALPLALIGAVVLAGIMDALDFSWQTWMQVAVLAAASALAAVLLVSVEGTVGLYGGLALIGGAIGWVAFSFLAGDQKMAARGLVTVGVGLLLTLTVRAGTMASFEHGDIPVEMLVYTQTSPDIPDLRDRIDALARESGLGYNLPIVVDATDGFSWPWAWYLRDYHDVQYPTIQAGFQPPENAVLLVAQGNTVFIDGTPYTQTPYRHRWWFIEESYRDLTVEGLWQRYTNPLLSLGPITVPKPDLGNFEHLFDFWLDRRSESFTGSVNAVAYFPATLSGYDIEQGPTEPAPPPEVQGDGRIFIGGLGTGTGKFSTPADVYVDSEGNIWVADSRNNRVQKFDREGHFISSLGAGGAAPGRLNEPWSVAVDDEGFIYVADTWNHRIQKFDRDFNLVKMWGEPFFGANPGPVQMYGPRDIAIAPDGTLWVSDTGNKRLINYTRDGDYIRETGRPGAGLGELDEAVGIDFDAAGNMFVADTWNERIQRFSPDLSVQTAYAASWTSTEAAHKPYLAVLTDGRLVAADPAAQTLLLYDLRGGIKTWKPDDGSRPIGVAALPDGGFVFSDAAKNLVQVVPASAVDTLFR